MERIRRAIRSRAACVADDEGGFSLLELVLASGLLALVMSSLAYVGTVAFSDAAVARSRLTATSLANEAIEQVRALPYDNVAKGLRTAELQAGTDPLITVSGAEYSYGGERIPHSSTSADAPIYPHLATHAVDGIDYTVGVYVTYLDDDTSSRAFRITSRVTWVSALRGVTPSVEAQTVVYSPASTTSGCGSTATHPYAAPCAPYFFANASTGDGGITVGAVSGDTPAISGLDIAEAMLQLPVASSNMTIEQIESVNSEAKTSGVSLSHTTAGQPTDTSGRSVVIAGADSDPSQPKPPYQQTTTPAAQSSGTASMSDSGSSITMTSSSGDTATATATVAATATNACANAASPPVPQLDALPCGNGSGIQAGTMSQQVNLATAGSITVASIGASSSTAHTSYDATPQASTCTATAGDGCVHASARAVVGPVRIGGLPSALASLAPPGFDYLLKLDGFTRTVSAEAGVGNVNPSSTTSGTITYWNGLSYSTVAVGTSTTTATIPIGSITISNPSTNTTLSISGTMRSGSVATPACASPCAEATAEAESPMVGDIRYTVVVNGSTVADFLVHVDFGSLVAHAEYVPSV